MTDLTPVDRAPATRDTYLSDAAWQLIAGTYRRDIVNRHVETLA